MPSCNKKTIVIVVQNMLLSIRASVAVEADCGTMILMCVSCPKLIKPAQPDALTSPIMQSFAGIGTGQERICGIKAVLRFILGKL